MSHVEVAHVMSLALFPMLIGFMSHVDFKKMPCRPVEFKGQGSLGYVIPMQLYRTAPMQCHVFVLVAVPVFVRKLAAYVYNDKYCRI